MPLTTAQIQNAYVAFFNRPADVAGLNYWSTYAGNTADLLNTFAQSSEYKALYANLNSTQLVNAVYTNLFGRAPEVAGLTYWVTQLDNGKLAIGSIADAINKGAQGADASIIANKVTAATSFTNDIAASTAKTVAYAGVNATGLQSVKDWLNTVTSDAASVTTATGTAMATVLTTVQNNVTVSGSTFTLSTGIDTITGTSGNDTVSAVIDTKGTTSTYQTGDNVNGGVGTDTLSLIITGDGTGSAPGILTASAIEVLKVQDLGTAGVTINLANVSGLTEIQSVGSTNNGDISFTNAGSVNTVTLKDLATASTDVNVTVANAAFTGTADAVTVNLNNVTADEVLTFQAATTAAGFETFNVVSAGTKSTGQVTLTSAAQAGVTTQTVNVTGAVDAKLAVSTTMKTVNASTFTGALNLDVSGAADYTVTGGSGNDRFNFGANFDANDTVDGGTGTNTLASSTTSIAAGAFVTALNSATKVKNIQALEYTGTAAYSIDGSVITQSGLTTYKTSGAIVAAAAASGTTVGTTGVAVTNETNAQTFSIENSVTGGVGGSAASSGAASGIGGKGMTFAPAVDNGSNTLNISLKGVTITGGAAGSANGGTTGASGGAAADFTTFETINITSTGATSTAVNTFTGGAATGAGTAGSTVLVSTNAILNISGANEINLGLINSSNNAITVNAGSLTGKATFSTGTAADTITGGSGVNVITLTGGADTVNLSASTAKADQVITTASTNTTSTAFVAITGFTNAATTGDKLDLQGTATVGAAVSAGTATGVTSLTGGVSGGILTFGGSAAATATLADKVTAAFSAAGANGVTNAYVIFEHSGSTYVAHELSGGAGFTAGTDELIQLVGVTGVTALSTSASAANTIFAV